MKIFFKKVRDVKSPSKAHDTDAGIDLYVPKINESFLDKLFELNRHLYPEGNDNIRKQILLFEKHINIPKRANILIPSGLCFNLPKGYCLVAFNKSSIASKKGLILGACVIDYGYTNEVIINFINVSDTFQYLKEGEKCIQLLLLPVPEISLIEKDFDSSNSRGGFGSTENYIDLENIRENFKR
jgi:dUTP pyrophosphatase